MDSTATDALPTSVLRFFAVIELMPIHCRGVGSCVFPTSGSNQLIDTLNKVFGARLPLSTCSFMLVGQFLCETEMRHLAEQMSLGL